MEDDDEHRQLGDPTALIDDLAGRGPPSRCSSPSEGPRHVRSGSFQRWSRQMQKAWRWGPTADGNADSYSDSGVGSQMNRNSNYDNRRNSEQGIKSSWNLELLANQKRQWCQIQMKAKDSKQYEEPTSLFEHFFVVGLHSYANVEAVGDAFARRKTWESEVARSEILDIRKIQSQARVPTLEPQAEAAGDFVSVMKCYLESLCSNLRSHAITNVQSNNDKVSLLLKDSFIDSFPTRDRPFIKMLADTQLFSVLSDSRLSTYENRVILP